MQQLRTNLAEAPVVGLSMDEIDHCMSVQVHFWKDLVAKIVRLVMLSRCGAVDDADALRSTLLGELYCLSDRC